MFFVTNFSDMIVNLYIDTFSYKNIYLKVDNLVYKIYQNSLTFKGITQEIVSFSFKASDREKMIILSEGTLYNEL